MSIAHHCHGGTFGQRFFQCHLRLGFGFGLCNDLCRGFVVDDCLTGRWSGGCRLRNAVGRLSCLRVLHGVTAVPRFREIAVIWTRCRRCLVAHGLVVTGRINLIFWGGLFGAGFGIYGQGVLSSGPFIALGDGVIGPPFLDILWFQETVLGRPVNLISL